RGDDVVSAQQGSLCKERRRRVETRLRAGDLKALVATASLELGIDIGPVELVCQIGSPRSIATFLQRVGRSNHSRAGTPKGRLYPLTRDELIECTALLTAVRAGRLDTIQLPALPLDIAAQQVVAELGVQEWRSDDIFLRGTHWWQIRKVELGVVRVRDAGTAPPTIPFWMGEAPARTAELSTEVSDLRAAVDRFLTAGDPDGAKRWLMETAGIDAE